MPLSQMNFSGAPTDDTAPLDAALRPVLSHLRIAGLACRTDARSELFQACALLQLERTRQAAAFAAALVRGLPEALGQRPVFLAPGETEMSFDEAWLLRAIEAHWSGDRASFDFLIRSRVSPIARRHVGFLIAGLADGTADQTDQPHCLLETGAA